MHDHVPGPSSSGSVVLDLGPGVGALVLYTPPELDGREIEISSVSSASAQRTHSLVRPRLAGSRTWYAAVYPQLPAGDYTVWADDQSPAVTVSINGSQVTTAWWPG